MQNNPNLELVQVNDYTKFGPTSLLPSQDIEQKWNFLTITKGHNSVVKLQKLTHNKSMHMQNLIKLHWFIHKILSGNEIFTINKGHDSVVNLQKLTHNNPSLDLVKVKCLCKIWSNSIDSSQVIERKQTDNNHGP